MAVSALNLLSSISCLCIAYGGMGIGSGLVLYIVDDSGIDVFVGLSLFLELIGSR